MKKMNPIDTLSIAAFRSLIIDGINKANSGHPGMALGSAPVIYTLFKNHLVSDPKDPTWCNRDRFILSAGHASMMLYGILHLCGYDISMDDLKAFRTIDSKTPGHPEMITPGIDAPSGPLGQGIAQAVGFALAERTIAAIYPEGEKIMNHYTYCLCGDGCLEEGISEEAIEVAGLQKLNKLILFYDANNITLDGPISLSTNTDIKKRFEASHWNVIEVKDANDIFSIDAAISNAKRSNKPTLIYYHSVIGCGSSKQGTNKCHGAPLGVEDGKATKVNAYHFDHEDFFIPSEVYENLKNTFGKRCNEKHDAYKKVLEKYSKDHKVEYERFINSFTNDVSKFLPDVYPDLDPKTKEATRVTSKTVLNTYALTVFNLFGGSADVASSTNSTLTGFENMTPITPSGSNMNWGIREFLMTAANNGMLLHGGIRPFCSSFFVFSDYMKPAIRMAALNNIPAIYVFTHDSLAVGQDGPTHQPIEQLATLRSIPNMNVIRPCDAREVYVAYQIALRSLKTPTAIVLTRQGVELLDSSYEGAKKGAYVIYNGAKKNADYEIIATGSEVSLAINAAKAIEEETKKSIRVISMPSWEIFESQDNEYKDSILSLPYEKRISIEMLTTFGWSKYAKYNYGVDTFGASGPEKDVYKKFGFTLESFTEYLKNIIK